MSDGEAWICLGAHEELSIASEAEIEIGLWKWKRVDMRKSIINK